MQNLEAELEDKASSLLSNISNLALHNHTTAMEHRTRKAQDFSSTESSLPQIKRPPATDSRPTIVDAALSHLGPYNPHSHPISANDAVWLFDNIAYRNPDTGKWEAEFVAAAWDKESGVKVKNVVASVAKKLGVDMGGIEERTIEERMMPFVREILPGRVVDLHFGGRQELKLGPGGRNAISSDVKTVPEREDGDAVVSKAIVPLEATGILKMTTVYAEPEGWGVISDIDDSIKVTQTSSPIGILRTTFISTPEPIKGMPKLYQYIQKLITPRAPFFYLSASPYNLYGFLSNFREHYYPQGTMILRDASWQNLSGLLSNLTLGVQEYKVGRMDKIHSWLPNRKMICIGDSTQSDPEAYGEIYRKYPGWVRKILIRKVTDIAAIGITEKNEPERFEKAFEGIPRTVWKVFEEPEECYDFIRETEGLDGALRN